MLLNILQHSGPGPHNKELSDPECWGGDVRKLLPRLNRVPMTNFHSMLHFF